MVLFWRNPEFVRHRRSELRQTRALAVVTVVVVICVLLGLACWISRQSALEAARRAAEYFDGRWTSQLAQLERRKYIDFWQLFFRVLMLVQAGVLTFWSLLSCAQSISGERDRKTWDFQRITRLSPTELLVGKVLGEPVLAYFIGLCCLPIAIVAGLAGHVRLVDIASAYVLILASALFIGLAGIWLSSLLESRSRGIGVIGALGLYAFIAAAYGFQETNFPGFGAFSPLTGLLPLLSTAESGRKFVATLFGAQVSWLLMSLLLYVAFGAWLVLMTVKNLKRDYDDVRPLSRWQAVGCATFLNFVAYSLFYPRYTRGRYFVTTMVMMNVVVLFVVGLATLTPPEHLRTWWRKRAGDLATLFSEDGLPLPWVVLSAVVAYASLVSGLFFWRSELAFEPGLFRIGAVQLIVVCLFVTRDVLFIQWCKLTRLRSPVIKGFLYLCLYYAASWIAAGVAAIVSILQYRWLLNILTPAGILTIGDSDSLLSESILLGVVLQFVIVVGLLRLIILRLRSSVMIQTAAAD